jgi:hypothetical protein
MFDLIPGGVFLFPVGRIDPTGLHIAISTQSSVEISLTIVCVAELRQPDVLTVVALTFSLSRGCANVDTICLIW